jgi:hypothetical protein
VPQNNNKTQQYYDQNRQPSRKSKETGENKSGKELTQQEGSALVTVWQFALLLKF